MPIKFRCQYCQQLLGISQSQAGAIVDCPQCGRDLRVPELDGTTRAIPKAGSSTSEDTSLLSALAELSGFDTSRNQNRPDSIVAEEPLHASASVHAEEYPQSSPQPSLHEPVVADIRNHLAELATLDQPGHSAAVSETLLEEMRAVSRPVGVPVATLLAALGLLITGLASGWYFGRGHESRQHTVLTAADHAPGNEMPADVENLAQKPVAERTISGTVHYRDGQQLLPDTGSLILILPDKRLRERHGAWKVDGQSLRRPPHNPDRIATIAALESFGVGVGSVGGDGTFAVPTQADVPLVGIVVSKHCQRPEATPVDEDLIRSLEEWFDDSRRLVGQLAVRILAVDPADSPRNILFPAR